MDQQAIRSQIPATGNVVYMNTGWSGPSPTSVVEAISRRLQEESDLGPASPSVLASGRGMRQELRESLAAFLNVSTEELTLTQNTTEGQNLVINGLAWQQGDEVITFSLEHNSVLAPCYYLERRHGTVTKVLPLDAGRGPRQHCFEGGGGHHASHQAAVHEPRAVQVGAAHAGGTAARGDAAARGADAARRRAGRGPRAARPACAGLRLLRDARPQVDAGARRHGGPLHSPRAHRAGDADEGLRPRHPLGARLGGLRAERVGHSEAGADHHQRRSMGRPPRGHPLPRPTAPGRGGGAQPLAGVSGKGGAGGGARRVDHVAVGGPGVLGGW